jgi:hypothetical protein
VFKVGFEVEIFKDGTMHSFTMKGNKNDEMIVGFVRDDQPWG